jgi:hypothetical protein
MIDRPPARTFTYRIDLDDRRAIRKIHRLDSLVDDYWITKLPKQRVPTFGSGRHWGFIFYQSTEHWDYDRNEMVGGTIPGLHKYRYSLEWEPCPADSLLEMRNATGGGTKIRGEQYVGYEDPRLPDYVPINTVVPWTPTEIEAMFDGEPVPDKVNYTYDMPEIAADTARDLFQGEIRAARRDGMAKVKEALNEYIENCDHKHAIDVQDSVSVAGYCEDCGYEWIDSAEMQYDLEQSNLSVVGVE